MSNTKLKCWLGSLKLKKPLFFFFNQWNELRGYMDNGGYCTYCTVNCTVSVTCPSSNIALKKSNT